MPYAQSTRAYLDPVWQKIRLDDVEPHVNFSILCVHTALVTICAHMAG